MYPSLSLPMTGTLNSALIGREITQARLTQPAPGSASPGKLPGLMLASRALAAEVSVPNQTVLQAAIEDLIVNPPSGRIQFVVVKTNVDTTERWIPVPLALFNGDSTVQGFDINLDLSLLQAVLPALEP
jgi:hypothetical protein